MGVLGGGEFTKNRYKGMGIAYKGGLGQFLDLRGGLASKRGGGVFEGGWA